MTVTTDANKVQELGNGVTKEFPFSFRIYAETDLIVVSTVIATGVDTDLVLGTDYTVTGVGSYNGGKVICPTAPVEGVRITIRRVLTVTQRTDLRNQGGYFAETHEDVFDRLTMIDQQQQEQLDRSLVFPPSAPEGISAVLPLPTAGRAVKWNAEGTALENSDIDPDAQVTAATEQAQAAATSATASAGSASTAEQHKLDAETAKGGAEDARDAAAAYAALIDPANLVHRTGVETIDGVKTFTSSPIVPTANAGDSSTKAASTAYADASATAAAAAVAHSAATQSEVEAGTSTTTFVSPGRQRFNPTSPKYIGSVSSAGTLTTFYSASGTPTCTRTAAGIYTIGGCGLSGAGVVSLTSKDPDRKVAPSSESGNGFAVTARDNSGNNSDAGFNFWYYGDL